MAAKLRLSMATAGLASSVAGCAIVGPTCLGRQQRGVVTTISGRLEAGQVATQLVPYERKGSQNDLEISWPEQGQPEGPRLRIYATSAGCADFVPPGAGDVSTNSGDCAIISRGGGYLAGNEVAHTRLIVTGPGNGAPLDFHEYELHVVGDAGQAAAYAITVTWFFGPDC